MYHYFEHYLFPSSLFWETA